MLSRISRKLSSLVLDFRVAFIADLLIIVPTLIVLWLTPWFSPIMDSLATSMNTPWGVLTSIFVHKDWLHFSQNVVSLIGCTFLFAMTNMHLTGQEKNKRSLFFLRNIFFSAILANVLWVLILPHVKSIGSSGAVYASFGVMMGFSCINFIHDNVSLGTLKRFLRNNGLLKQLSGKRGSPRLFNFLIFMMFLIFILIAPKEFLSVAPEVNAFAHFIGFLASFMITFFATDITAILTRAGRRLCRCFGREKQ